MFGKTGWMVALWDQCKLIFYPGWIRPKPVYAAAGLLLLTGGLLFTVASSLESGAERLPVPAAEITDGTGERLSPSVGTGEAVVEPAKPAAAVAPVAAAETACWPLQGKIQREMGWQLHPVFLDWRYHTGIDIQAKEEQPVQAMFSGRVTDIYTDNGSGLTVVVAGEKYTVYYGSLAAAAVAKGSRVTAGSRIGTAGLCDAEPYLHLHLAVKKGDNWIDPRELTNN
ncbi:MAG: M23 family metallopeptidase [Veillonellales bacterium]